MLESFYFNTETLSATLIFNSVSIVRSQSLVNRVMQGESPTCKINNIGFEGRPIKGRLYDQQFCIFAPFREICGNSVFAFKYFTKLQYKPNRRCSNKMESVLD